ncbi:MAG: aspartyl protease family protein [Acidobacteriota bacterium]
MFIQTRAHSTLVSAVVALGLAGTLRGGAFQGEPPDVQLLRAQTSYASGRYRDALVAFAQVAHADAPAVKGPAQIGLVQSALRVAEFDLARSTATELLRDSPGDASVLSIYGDAMWSAGLFPEAHDAYQRAVSLNPDQARAHNGLARVLAAKLRYDAALDAARTAVRLAPDEADYAYTLGATYQRMGHYPEAADALERFVRLLPKADKDDRAAFARSTIVALRAYGRRIPYRIASNPDGVYVLPFRLADDKIIVAGRINGSAEGEFVVDTGAELATVSRRAVDRQGVTPLAFTVSAGVGEVGLRGLQIGRIDSLELSGLRIQNVPCIIKTPALSSLPAPERDSVSPLALGLSMTVDYAKRTITLARHLPADEAPASETMSLWLTRLATVRGMVGDEHPRSFVVDTGGQVISISTDTARALPAPAGATRIALKVYGASGWDREAYLLPGVNLAFNDIRFNRMSVVVLSLRAPSVLLGYELGGIVGHQFLSKYHVSFDLEKAELRLRK